MDEGHSEELWDHTSWLLSNLMTAILRPREAFPPKRFNLLLLASEAVKPKERKPPSKEQVALVRAEFERLIEKQRAYRGG